MALTPLARHSTLLQDSIAGRPCDVGADRSESDSADRDGLAVLVAVDECGGRGPHSLTPRQWSRREVWPLFADESWRAVTSTVATTE